jgi:hypothetical protein
MKKFLCSMALAFLGWAALSQQAAATTVLNFDSTIAANSSFQIAHAFSFSGNQDGSFGAAANKNAVSNLSAAICADASCSGGALFTGTPSTVGLFTFSDGSFLNLASATYYLVISGLTSATPGSGSTYLASITLTPTVPVPPAVLLFVTALGGLGLFGRFCRASSAA